MQLLWKEHTGIATIGSEQICQQYLKQSWRRRSQCNSQVTIQWLGKYWSLHDGHSAMVITRWSQYNSHDTMLTMQLVTVQWLRCSRHGAMAPIQWYGESKESA